MSIRTHSTVMTLLLAGALAAPAAAQRQIADTATTTVRASVEAIDRTARIVTLRGPQGNLTQFQVADDVDRFDDLAVGDTITATFTEAIAIRLRKPDEPQPLADQTVSEPGNRMAQRTISVTVEDIDRSVPSMTVMDPDGNELSFRVPDDVSLEDVEVGDHIDVTYSIAMVVDVN